MLSIRHLAIVTTGFVALSGCAKPGAPVADTAADEAAIRAVNPAWFQAYAAGDADAVAALYAEDAVFSPPGGPAVRGRAAIRDFVASDIAASSSSGLKFAQGTAGEFGVSGDLGWEWNTFSVADASGTTIDNAKYVTVFGRRDGKWLIIRDIYNSDMPPAPAAATEAAPAEAAAAPEPTE